MSDEAHSIVPKLLIVITDRNKTDKVKDIFLEYHMRFFYACNAVGSASSEIMNVLGLDGTEKSISFCLTPGVVVKSLMDAFLHKLALNKKGKGIAFTVPVSGMSSSLTNVIDEEIQRLNERWGEIMMNETEKVKENRSGDLVLAVINQGFSDDLMEAARGAGAKGGTIIHARRIGLEEIVKFFGISLQEEKEVVAIYTDHEHKRNIMQAICKGFGMKTDAKGLVLSLPVDNVLGLNFGETDVLKSE